MIRSAPRMQRWYPRLHRWLGLGCLLFVLVLSGTGIALNHSSALGLDTRYVRAEWVLSWFGIAAPPPTTSFLAGAHSVALLGTRLYFDDVELVDGVTELVGAVAMPDQVVIATAERVLLVSRDGALVEQFDVGGTLPTPVIALGRSQHGLVFETSAGRFHADGDVIEITDGTDGAVDWSTPEALSPERLEQFATLYRGRGLSLERLLLDLHSGRALRPAGVWLMDLVGAALIVLSLLGVLLWWQRRPPRRRP